MRPSRRFPDDVGRTALFDYVAPVGETTGSATSQANEVGSSSKGIIGRVHRQRRAMAALLVAAGELTRVGVLLVAAQGTARADGGRAHRRVRPGQIGRRHVDADTLVPVHADASPVHAHRAAAGLLEVV